MLWTISGIYFSFNDIEEIRGEHYYRDYNQAPNEEKVVPQTAEQITTEQARQIIIDKTILLPQSIEMIKHAERGAEYRGLALPLYQTVTHADDGTEVNVYQDPQTGKIVAIRTLRWRIWDLLWGLHIMDWIDRDAIDGLLLKIFSIIALFTSLSGIVLFFRKNNVTN